MAENTEISWTDATFNPWIECTKVSPGCDNCYAAAQDKFRKWTPEGWGAGMPRKRTKTWGLPVKWNTAPFYQCSACGWRGDGEAASANSMGLDFTVITCPYNCNGVLRITRRRVFCASLADVFDNQVPVEWRVDLLRLICQTPNLDWLLLTKRIGNVASMLQEAERQIVQTSYDQDMHGLTPMLEDWLGGSAPPNVWIGATVVNQEEADRDIPKLLATPARVRFLSMEPLLGQVSLWGNGGRDIGWVIVGGESGPGARPMHPDWARSLRDQCAAAGVPFLFKQWGECVPATAASDGSFEVDDGCGFDHEQGPGRLRIGWVPPGEQPGWYYARIGKKAAGRLLDGVTHDAFPEVSHG